MSAKSSDENMRAMDSEEEEDAEEPFDSVWDPFDTYPDGDDKPAARFWKINPKLLALEGGDSAKPNVAVFFPFLDPFQKNRVSMVSSLVWDDLRCFDDTSLPIDWEETPAPTLDVMLLDGREQQFSLGQGYSDDSAFCVKTWDRYFDEGQKWAATATITSPWTKSTNLKIRKTVSGAWPTDGDDTRMFMWLNDGIGFAYAGWGGVLPDEMDDYVKLSAAPGRIRGEAVILLLSDSDEMFKPGLHANDIYIPKKIMDQLRTGTYSFAATNYYVPVRNRLGKVGYVRCDTSKHRKTDDPAFWQRAYDNGVKVTAWTGARWRTANGLKLAFVISGSETSAQTLQDVVNQAAQNGRTKETATVYPSAAEKPSEFNWLLSKSPFGDFETWIREEDYTNFLQAYPGYDLPTEEILDSMKTTMKAMLDSQPNPALSGSLTQRLRKALGYAQIPTGTNASIVSYKTMLAAARPGARGEGPDQQRQIGGSATEIAVAAGWPSPRVRVGAKGIWSSPGVYPAEWLHRTAFSWGSIGGVKANQVASNLIFGSSEANSLMTRYEKAWQRLFRVEHVLNKDKRWARVTALSGTLMTTNTPANVPVVMVSPNPDQKSVRTVEVSSGKDGQPPTAKDNNGQTVMGPGGGYWPDYWAAALAYPNLSWSLTYSMTLTRHASLLNIDVLPKQIFYPFQRSFFTSLEARVDQLLLRNRQLRLMSSAPHPSPASLSIEAQMGVLALNPGSSHQQAAASEDGPPLMVGGALLHDPAMATVDSDGRLMLVSFASGGTALVAKEPLPTAAEMEPYSTAQALCWARGDMAPCVACHSSQTEDIVGLITTADPSAMPPDGYVTHGTITIFGICPADMYDLPKSPTQGKRQIVPLQDGLVNSLWTLFRDLDVSGYSSAIALKNTAFVYNQFPTPTTPYGTWIQTDVVFSGLLQTVNDLLRTVFSQTAPAIHVEAFLFSENNWERRLSVGNGLTFRGSLPNINIALGNVARITELGINVGLSRSRTPWPTFDTEFDHSIGFFGSLDLLTKNMGTLAADFQVLDAQGVLEFMVSVRNPSAIGPSGFGGVTGLQISQLDLQATLAPGANASSVMGFTASAEVLLRDSTLKLWGFYSMDDWLLTCQLEDFTLNDLRDMYEDLLGAELNDVNCDITFDNLSFSADSSGLAISGSVTVQGHTAATATISIDEFGVQISGGVNNVSLGSGIVLESASLDVFIGIQGQQESTISPLRFAIHGNITTIGGRVISATMFFSRDLEGGLLWTVVGAFEGSFLLSELAPALRGTFLDLAVDRPMLIVSNVDGNGLAGAAMPPEYQAVDGLQVAGTLMPISALSNTLGGDPLTGLTLQAVYATWTSSWILNIMLAKQLTLSLLNGVVTSTQITLRIEASTSPTIALKSNFYLQMPAPSPPLLFGGGFTIGPKDANLSIELKNQWWQNPFGLSPQLKLGPDLALQIGVDFNGPAYTVGLAAGLAVGQVTGKAALSVSDNPENELIMLHIENLGVRDLVKFAGALFQVGFPEPDDDFLVFQNFYFYLSPGTTIGSTEYKRGASFDCDALFWGHEAAVSCRVLLQTGQDQIHQIHVWGSLQTLAIGPLLITGFETGTPAQLEVQFGPKAQSVSIKGSVTLFGLQAKASMEVQVLPEPVFRLETELVFSEQLTFILKANMRPGTFTSDLTGLEFDVDAVLDQALFSFIAEQVAESVTTAGAFAEDTAEQAKSVLEQVTQEYQVSVNQAKQQLESAKKAYEDKLSSKKNDLFLERASAARKRETLVQDYNQKNQTYLAAVTAAQQQLEDKKAAAAAKIEELQRHVTDLETKANQDISAATQALFMAQTMMHRRFDAVNAKIKSAQANVDSHQNSLDAAQKAVDDAQKAYDNAIFLGRLDAMLDLRAKQEARDREVVALNRAQSDLLDAKGATQTPDYQFLQTNIDYRAKKLADLQTDTRTLLNTANTSLQQGTSEAQGEVTTANMALWELRAPNNPQKMAVAAAEDALTKWDDAEGATLKSMQDAIDAVQTGEEANAVTQAEIHLHAAESDMASVNAAAWTLQGAVKTLDAVRSVSGWVAKHSLNLLLIIQRIEVSGDLRTANLGKTQLSARIVGTFAGFNVDFSLGFIPGEGIDFAQNMFKFLINDVEEGNIKIEQ